MDDLSLFTNVTQFPDGEMEVRYAFGPDWVPTAMLVDDYGFLTEEEAVKGWFRSIYDGTELKSEEEALDWYNNIFKARLENDYSSCETEDRTEDSEPCDKGDPQKVPA